MVPRYLDVSMWWISLVLIIFISRWVVRYRVLCAYDGLYEVNRGNRRILGTGLPCYTCLYMVHTSMSAQSMKLERTARYPQVDTAYQQRYLLVSDPCWEL